MEEYSIENLVKSLCDPQIPDLLFDTELDLENQRVITMDVARTKSDILTPEERLLLEKMLTYYCKTENISYKQGINEILAPFLLLNRSNIPLSVCYNCFKNFVKKFIPTLFANDVRYT
jgi:Rab-GTPase-TBC domain